jgi:hypothetical protein
VFLLHKSNDAYSSIFKAGGGTAVKIFAIKDLDKAKDTIESALLNAPEHHTVCILVDDTCRPDERLQRLCTESAPMRILSVGEVAKAVVRLEISEAHNAPTTQSQLRGAFAMENTYTSTSGEGSGRLLPNDARLRTMISVSSDPFDPPPPDNDYRGVDLKVVASKKRTTERPLTDKISLAGTGPRSEAMTEKPSFALQLPDPVDSPNFFASPKNSRLSDNELVQGLKDGEQLFLDLVSSVVQSPATVSAGELFSRRVIVMREERDALPRLDEIDGWISAHIISKCNVASTSGMEQDEDPERIVAETVDRNLSIRAASTKRNCHEHNGLHHGKYARDVRVFCKNRFIKADANDRITKGSMTILLPKESEREIQVYRYATPFTLDFVITHARVYIMCSYV